ncbi:DUF3558 domain-containing protein [Nocardia flavorosea]|uniref:DUF3558 domain-containing protein n=1 Tax=Nocardia flavorosea TaxID=53429 RepID=UPI0024569241|nr:DUF3558 domain-containing protein [Nocardia flavorosea]
MRLRLALLSAAALLAAGCGTDTSGTPTPSTTEKPTTVAFNPCDELSAEALQAAGLDPATKKTSVDSPDGQPSAWKICFWRPADRTPYAVSVGSSTFTMDDLPSNETVTGFEDVQIGSRAAKTYHQANSPTMLRCFVAFPSGSGMANVIVDWDASERETAPETPPCTLAVEKAQQLEPYLPQ